MMIFDWNDTAKFYINLDKRIDRKLLMEKELARVGIKAERIKGMLPHEYTGDPQKIKVMYDRTKGAIGCHFTQCKCMQHGFELQKHVLIMEDDLIFCDDLQDRIPIIEQFLNSHQWDLVWLGGTFHVNPPHWHTGHNPDLIGATIGRDAETTDNPRIMRTYGCFSTYAYIVNWNSLGKILNLLDQHVHESMGIDWLFIKLQPQLKTFAFVPGCVKQYDNKSDIGKGYTMFSGFAKLNGTIENSKYWWQKRMTDFDPLKFNWSECQI